MITAVTFLWGNHEFYLRNQMVLAIPFEKLQKIWTVNWNDTFFLVCSVSSADLAKVCGKSFFHKVKFNRLMFIKRDSLFMFTHKISNRMVCIDVKQPKVSLWTEENEITS